jgi:hypothetical protein
LQVFRHRWRHILLEIGSTCCVSLSHSVTNIILTLQCHSCDRSSIHDGLCQSAPPLGRWTVLVHGPPHWPTSSWHRGSWYYWHVFSSQAARRSCSTSQKCLDLLSIRLRVPAARGCHAIGMRSSDVDGVHRSSATWSVVSWRSPSLPPSNGISCLGNKRPPGRRSRKSTGGDLSKKRLSCNEYGRSPYDDVVETIHVWLSAAELHARIPFPVTTFRLGGDEGHRFLV